MIHLHTKSCWSLLESPLRIDQIVQAAKQNNQAYAALTDRNVMYGTMAFLHACQKENIKPIVGLECSVAWKDRSLDLILLAKDAKGLSDLYRLSTAIQLDHQTVLDLSLVKEHAGRCAVLTGGADACMEDLCAAGKTEELAELLSTLSETFEDFTVSIALNDSYKQRQDNQVLRAVAQSLLLPTAALSRVEYLEPGDDQKARLLQAIDKQTGFQDPSLQVRRGRYFRSQKEMEQLYEPQDLQATEDIASRIHLSLDLETTHLPRFQNKLNISSEEYLKKLCRAGLEKRLLQLPFANKAEYASRLEYELSVIVKMGFADYFLIVWDFIRYARSQNILVGPGRGSAAGSLVSYCLGITHIDPVANQLLFERFLNPERISMPDIDTDFPDNRRDEVIRYVAEKYGAEHVAHIVTFSTMKAKGVLRDVGKALHIHVTEIDKLARLIGNDPKMTLAKIYSTNDRFRKLVDNSQSLSRLYAAALPLEGLPRHASIHAGGIVFSGRPLAQVAPLTDCSASVGAIQFTMEHLEELGLIKFDFLGIRNLSILQSMNEAIGKDYGKQLDLLRLPLDDPKTYRLLQAGDTLGIFQMEKSGIRQLAVQFQPKKFEDIAAILALYRPGPMQNIGLYLQARNHTGPKNSLHPLLDPILAETGGIFLYQEQIMKAAQIVGGFSLAQADSLRKAMSKKDRARMESYRNLFLQGAAKQNIAPAEASKIFEVMERFADYGFNKSHSYAYGLVVYQMAYIKANYPVQFYICTLNACTGDSQKTAEYLQECAGRNLKVLPVSLNRSLMQYALQPEGLRMPFTLLKGMGPLVCQKIIEERQARGPFENPATAITRLTAAGLSRSHLETLIDAGAMDEMGYTRATLKEGLERMIRYARMVQVETGTEPLFDYDNASYPQLVPAEDRQEERLEQERAVYGFYVSEHPVTRYRKQHPRALSLQAARQNSGPMEVLGRIVSVHTHKTKQGQMMAFVTVEDEKDRLDLAVMPALFERLRPDLEINKVVAVKGQKNRPDSLLTNSLQILSPSRQEQKI